MTITQLFVILYARAKVFFAIFIFIVISAVIVILILPKKYTATTTVIVNYKWADPISGLSLPAQLMPGYMATQVDIISSKNVALNVVDSLKLDKSKYFIQEFSKYAGPDDSIKDWISNWLIKRLDVSPSRTSNTIAINFKAKTPKFAALVADTFAKSYIQRTIELKVEPAQKAAVYFTKQMKELQENLDNAQSKLSKYQQDHAIMNVDSNLDVENARLNALSSDLVTAQSQAMDANTRRLNADRAAVDSPDIASNSMVQSLKTQLSAAEVKLSDVSSHYGSGHPEYIAAQSQVNKLQSQLSMQTRSVARTVEGTAKILSQNLQQTQGALEAQKKKILALSSNRNELNVLSQQVATAQAAYTAATQKFNQNNFEGKSDQSDIAILNQASVPSKASSPKSLLILAGSILMGGFLGLAFVLISELFDRRIRSAEDLVSIINAPLLGEIPKIKLNREKWSLLKAVTHKKQSLISNKMRSL